MDFNIKTGLDVKGEMSREAADRYANRTGSGIRFLCVGCVVALVLWALSPVLVALINKFF